MDNVRPTLYPLRCFWLAVLSLALGCGGGTPESVDRPIVVIGFDGADWTWIDPRIEAGAMPNFASLVDRGVRRDLLSLVPPAKSPTIWTSIATGKVPAKHGVRGFVKRGEEVTGSAQRTATTYWEILGAVGRIQAVIGWWVTHPATPVNGVLVSDYVPYFSGRTPIAENAVFPPEVVALVEKNRVVPESMTLAELARFVDVDVAAAHGADAQKLLLALKWIYAGDETFRRVARALYEDRPDVFTVYFRGVDAVSHVYWKYFQPADGGEVKAWEVEMLGGVVSAYYDYADELLGEIVGYVDPRSRILVCSDHGFAGRRETPRGVARGVQMHDDEGILILAGPGLRRGETLPRADVTDIAPTLLAMAGIPPARDMDGIPLADAFVARERRMVARLVDESVDSYEGIVSRIGDSREGDEGVDQEMLERLRALGYID